MTDEERKIAEAVQYYLSIGCRWCWIIKRFHNRILNKPYSKQELERFVCLLNKERQDGIYDKRVDTGKV